MKSKRGKRPPCETCLPEPNERNREAMEVFQLCARQFVPGPLGEPVDVNNLAIEQAMDRLHVHPDRRDECFRKVRIATGKMLDIMKKRNANAKG